MKVLRFNNRIVKCNDKWSNVSVNPGPGPSPDPYNPLNLPPNTIRCKFNIGYTPSVGDSQTLVDLTNNIWDIYKQSNDWSFMFFDRSELLEVLGANTTNVTNMDSVFRNCNRLTTISLFNTSNVVRLAGAFNGATKLISIPLFNTSKVTNFSGMLTTCFSLTSVPLFDTSNATNLNGMLCDCRALTYIPLFNTSKATMVNEMCHGCHNVESGALALYNQMSTQINPPTEHFHTFIGCGIYTETGAAELAQIPDDWK